MKANRSAVSDQLLRLCLPFVICLGLPPESGTTKVRIVVKGAYTDDDMDTRIGDEWKRLHELTLDTLRPKNSVTGDQA